MTTTTTLDTRQRSERKTREFAACAFVFLTGVLVGCSTRASTDATATSTANANAAREVKTAVVREETWPRTLRSTGELAAFEEATISTKVAGRLDGIAVDLGSRVKRGDVLASIEARDFDLRLTASKTALQAARARLGLSIDGDGMDDTIAPDDAAIVMARVFVDTFAGALCEAGDLVQPLQRGSITRAHILGELADLARAGTPARRSTTEITLFKSVGTALEDLAAAQMVYDAGRLQPLPAT